MSEWQPIETVPRDGTEVILAKGDRVSSGAFIVWKQSDSEFSSTGVYLGEVEYDSGESFGTWDGGFCDDDQPTHWMPLPAPPTK